MSPEPSGVPMRGDKASTVRPGQVVRPTGGALPEPEIRLEDGRLFLTVDCPDIDQEALRYAIGPHHVVVWSERLSRLHRRVIRLPAKVFPKSNRVAYRNGVLDISIRVAAGHGDGA